MSCKVIGKTVADGERRWRLNGDGSWSVLMFGSHPYQQSPGLVWRWVTIEEGRVPDEVKRAV